MLRTVIAALLGLVGSLLAAELVLRALPVSTATMTGYYVDADVMTYPPGHTWTSSLGWDLRNPQRLSSNNLGFAAGRDFIADPAAIGLIGDSQVEAAMLDAERRPDVQLETLIGSGRRVYGLGSPGTALLDYAQRIRFARDKLQLNDFVLWLEAGDARQALCGSGNVQSRCLDPQTLEPRVERRPDPSPIKRVARHSALAQYLFGQLKLRAEALLAATFSRQTPAEPGRDALGTAKLQATVPDAVQQRSRQVVDVVLERFFADMPMPQSGRLLFAVDGRRTGPTREPNALDLERRYLIDRLRARGVDVIDLEPAYAAHAARSKLSLEVGPYDRHLNALGVQLVMTQIAEHFRP